MNFNAYIEKKAYDVRKKSQMAIIAKIASQIICPGCKNIMYRFYDHIECHCEDCHMFEWKFEIPEVEIRRCKHDEMEKA